MVTPIRTMTIEQICERKDDLLIGSDDVRDLARNERNKAIDEFVEKLEDSLAHNYRHFLNVDTDGFEWITTDAVDTHIQEIAKQLKGV